MWPYLFPLNRPYISMLSNHHYAAPDSYLLPDKIAKGNNFKTDLSVNTVIYCHRSNSLLEVVLATFYLLQSIHHR